MNLASFFLGAPAPIHGIYFGWKDARHRRQRYGGEFQDYLAEYLANSFKTKEEIEAIRSEKLSRYLAEAPAHTPFYKNAGNLSPQSIGRLPLLNKDRVKADFSSLLNPEAREARINSSTSGTTGKELVFPETLEADRRRWAIWWRWRMWHGITLDTPGIFLSHWNVVHPRRTTPPFWRISRTLNEAKFSAFHLSARTAPFYLEKMKELGYSWLSGHPASLAALANHALALGIRFNFKWITVNSENLLPYQLEAIRNAFGSEPIRRYGLNENVASFAHCPKGKYHVDEDYSFVEFLPEGGNQYRIVGTNFTNRAFSLLRYDTGDLATLDPSDHCDCGRPGRIVSSIDGRQIDLLVTKSGEKAGIFAHVLTVFTHIQELQFVQKEPGRVEILIVKTPSFCQADEDRILDTMKTRFGGDLDYEILYVHSIARTKSGKLRLVVSHLSGNVSEQSGRQQP